MKNFNELGLAEPLLQAIEELGYEHPMPVQEEVIPHLLNNDTDLVALAQAKPLPMACRCCKRPSLTLP